MSDRHQLNALLEAATARAAGQSFFLARDLEAFERVSGRSRQDVLRWLGAIPERSASLGLCRTPSRGASFRSEVSQIAERFGLDPWRLGSLLREVDALGAFDAGLSATGWLAAARDREEPDGVD